MTLGGIVILLTALLILPALTGLVLLSEKENALRCFILGYLIDWSVFFLIALVQVIRGSSLSSLCFIYLIFIIVLSILGILTAIVRRLRTHDNVHSSKQRVMLNRYEIVYLGILIAVIGFQFYKTLFYSFADGDDAFYIATAHNAVATDTMYQVEAYTGFSLGKDCINYRYALAPFPMWLAYLSKISGIHVATVAYVFVPILLIGLTYMIYWEIGKQLFKKDREKMLVFMDAVAIIILFSNVSTSTAETFLLTRARQGKEALANIILPMLFLLMAGIHEQLKENSDRINVLYIAEVIITSLCASLMSVFGSVLYVIALFGFGLILLFEKKRLRVLLDVAVMAVPSVCFVGLYMILG